MKYLHYYDNGACDLWDSRESFEECDEMEDNLSKNKYREWLKRHLIAEFPQESDGCGYAPAEVVYLCGELGIEVGSI